MEIFFNALFFLLGVFAVIIYQYYQSKEVLKQTLYKEKLRAYREIVAELWYSSVRISKETEDYQQDLLKLHQVIAIHDFIIADDLIKSIYTYMEDLYNANTAKDYKNQDLIMSYWDIINLIRDDLGVSKLSKELADLYTKFPASSLLKSKNKT